MSRGIYDKVNQRRIPIAGAQLPNVDNVLSSTSENPVQNKVIKQALDNKQNTLTFDDNPTANSNNPVKSSGVYTALDGKASSSHNHAASDINSGILEVARGGTGVSTLTSGRVLVGNGTGAVKFRAIDTTSGGTSGSTNLITSGAVKSALDTMNSNFQAGCNIIVQAVTAKGVTPASNSPSDIASAIGNISTGVDPLDILLGISTINIEDTLLKMTKSQFDTYKSQLVGKTVSISNSQQDGAKSMDWVIIDYNHDSTTYTFDLWASRAMFDSVVFSNDSNRYDNSSCTARTKIEGAITGFSSELQAKLQTMAIVSNDTTISSKIKLLSMTEMGISDSNTPTEGNVYDKYFTTGRSTGRTYADLIRYDSSGNACSYWFRSCSTGNSSWVWYIYNSGYVYGNFYGNSRALIPAIRIAVG